jgi:hypothetical protein
VENLVAIELAYINTKHPDFHKDAALVSSLVKNAELNQSKPIKKHPSTYSNSTNNAIIPVENVSNLCFLLRVYLINSIDQLLAFSMNVRKVAL